MKKGIYKAIILLICYCLCTGLQAQTRSPKRGVSFNFTNNEDLKALQPGTSWFYNWAATPNNVTDSYYSVYGYEFCPMAWNGNWNSSAIRNYVKNNPDCKYLLAFNEPNFREQANLTPRQAADRWPDLMALARELNLKVISPACNYSAWAEYGTPAKWFDEFFQYVDIEDVDGIAIHSYMGWSVATANYVKEYIEKYNKPIWLTEFCAWDNFGQNQGGTALVQRREMVDLLEYLETEPMVARYAWFIPRRDEITQPTFPYMELLTNTNKTEKGVLTETGLVWTYMSSYDNSYFHNVDECIEAEHYITRSKGIYMEKTSDEAGVINICDYNVGGELTYNVDIPNTGEYTIRLRVMSNTDSRIDIVSTSGTYSKDIEESSNNWTDKEIKLNLEKGKQQLTFKLTEGSLRLNYFVITNNGARPSLTPNPPSEIVIPKPTGKNYALHKQVESSSEDDLQDASFATDGNSQTRWESRHGQGNKHLIIDLEQAINLTDIIINWEGAYASRYNVEISSDKSQWVEIYNTTQGKAGEERIKTDYQDVRYIKVNCIKRATTYGFSVYEIEAYGKSGTGIDEIGLTSQIAYPNPVKDLLFISSPELNKTVFLYDINGRCILTETNPYMIDMNQFTSGVYLLRLDYENKQKSAITIIKE